MTVLLLNVLRRLGIESSKVECTGLMDGCTSCALNHPDYGCLCILINETLEYRGEDPEAIPCPD